MKSGKIKTEIKKTFKKKDLEINIDENLNINDEICHKTSSKVLNTLLSNRINTDSNLSMNQNLFRGTIHLTTAKNQAFFSNQKSYTKKELRRSLSGYFSAQKRASIKNFRNQFSSNQNFGKNSSSQNLYDIKMKKDKINYIEYGDLYFEDDILIPESSSFPNEYEEDFLLRLKFIEDNDYNEDIEHYNIRYNSISYNINFSDNIHMKFFNNNNSQNKKIDKKASNTFKIDNLFFDEKEIEGRNILYLDSKNSNKHKDIINNDNSIKNDSNENNISYISLDLLIKKIALENFRKSNAYIYNCFLQQFKYFIPMENFIKKIILAFNYFNNKKIKENSSELVNFLNELILQNYNEIKLNKNIMSNIQYFYLKAKNIKFDCPKVNEDLIKINNLLFKKIINNQEKKENNINNNKKDNLIGTITTLHNLVKFKTKSIFNKAKKKKDVKEDKDSKLIKIKEKKHNYNYFYIFDYTKEEIAAYLTVDSYQLLSKIPESELFNKNFNGSNKEKNAPNVVKIIERYDKLILFIIEDICSYDHKSVRVDIIEKWLRIAFVCKELRNFNDLVMLNSLFCNYLLNKKMKLTWKKLSKKSFEYIIKLNRICSGNWRYLNLRKEILKCKGKPYVPYLGILLKELMIAEEMKYITNKNINILKLDKINKIIKSFYEFKNQKYSFEKPENLDILNNIHPKSEEEIELIIRQLEPKLLINANKNDKKRITQSDKLFYKLK